MACDFTMPYQNQFQHQSYPTQPAIQPLFQQMTVDAGEGPDFSRLHTDLRVEHVVLVHGTFMGDDPFAIVEMLRSIGESAPALKGPVEALAAKIQQHTKPLTDRVAGDVGNYTPEFCDEFQRLVGDDPQVQLMNPTWSGQNHHLARADLAVRLLCLLDDLQAEPDRKVLLWGHSHAGNGFAILSNLLANDRESVGRLFKAAGPLKEEHWLRAERLLVNAATPHPLASSVMIASFGAPVRYGWDTSGYDKLVHVLHHRNFDDASPLTAKRMYPPHSFGDMLSAKYGDWVQAFGIAGTDVSVPTAEPMNGQLGAILEAGLAEPVQGLDTKFILSTRVRNACARWKTGTRCHADGQNLLVNYQPSGRSVLLVPVEETLFGHGVATTVNWLPAHLALVLDSLGREIAR